MANVVKLKRSAVQGKTPETSALELGEVALNTFDGNLFFKKDNGSESIVEVLTTDGSQTLYNKTLDNPTTNTITITGSLYDNGGSDGTVGQILTSTGNGIEWQTNTAGNLAGLGDVTFSGLTSGQIIKYNGTVWVNSEENAVVSSAVFAANAQTDLGLVTDEHGASEDLEPNDGSVNEDPLGDTDAYYNLGSIAIDGVVGLRNVDQSLKSDYISYSIIFGF